jgi:broad specificity phosphatase PhoE
VAEESAGGGHLPELQARLAELRETDNPEGIEEAEAAAAALAETLQQEPRVASSAYLDALGSASRRLELALGESGVSPFAAAMQAALGSVEELSDDVERNYKFSLA